MPRHRTDDPALAGQNPVPQGARGRHPATDPTSRKAGLHRQAQVSGPARWSIPGKSGKR